MDQRSTTLNFVEYDELLNAAGRHTRFTFDHIHDGEQWVWVWEVNNVGGFGRIACGLAVTEYLAHTEANDAFNAFANRISRD